MLRLIAHTELFFPILLVGLILIVELGFRVRRLWDGIDTERQSLVESARDGLGVLLGLLLGLSTPMALPHYEQRTQLVIDEANAIRMVEQRADMLPEPFRDKILQSLREYVNERIEYASADLNSPKFTATISNARRLQNKMLQQAVILVQQNPTAVTPIFVQALGGLTDMMEQRLAATEKHIPTPMWLVFILVSALTCFVVGYSMRRRVFVAVLVLPLTVAIVLSLVSELDNSRAGLVRISQQSMKRLQLDLQEEVGLDR